MSDKKTQGVLLEMTAEIVSAFVSHNPVQPNQLLDIIQDVHGTLLALSKADKLSIHTQLPAVPPQKSIEPDYLICLEDGKQLKLLKRYLRTKYNMEPDEYRAKWSLPEDYPMVAPNYAKTRSTFAKKIGLGKKK